MSVRRDRKYFTSLALHEAVATHYAETPLFVKISGLHGAKKVRPLTHGGATDLIDEWVSTLESGDSDVLLSFLRGDDEHSVEMRNSTVFLSVLAQEERRSILDGVAVDHAEG